MSVTLATAGTLSGETQAAPGIIHGVVRAESGAAIAGATVVVSADGSGREELVATTDANGGFVVRGLRAGDYTVAAYFGPRVVRRHAVNVTTTFSRRVNLTFNEANTEAAYGFTIEEPAVAAPWADKARRGWLSLGAEMDFVSGGDIGFADLVVFRPEAKIVTGQAIYRARLDLLAKAPEADSDETLQSAHVGVSAALGESGTAHVDVAAGRQQSELGHWSTADIGGSWRRDFFPFFGAEGRLAAQTTSLFNRHSGDQWLAEASVGGRLLFEVPCIKSRARLGADVFLPLAHSGGSSRGFEPIAGPGTGIVELDPRTRIAFEIGFALGALRDWDMSLSFSLNDRGDRDVAGTTLPILVGGTDQTHVVFSTARRFGGGG